MLNFWKKKPALGVGLGVGLMGAVFLAVRYGMQRVARQPLPDIISPAIFATRVCQTTHGEIVYHTSGAGEPLVFLHGIYPGASSFEWSRVYPQFAVGHEVIAPDLIGFGESNGPAAVSTRTTMCARSRICFSRSRTVVQRPSWPRASALRWR